MERIFRRSGAYAAKNVRNNAVYWVKTVLLEELPDCFEPNSTYKNMLVRRAARPFGAHTHTLTNVRAHRNTYPPRTAVCSLSHTHIRTQCARTLNAPTLPPPRDAVSLTPTITVRSTCTRALMECRDTHIRRRTYNS